MSHSIGEQLRQAREAKKLSLEQVSLATRIRLPYLQALEEDDFERLPSLAQARGFLRTYAGFLNINLDDLEYVPAVKSEEKSAEAENSPAVPLASSLEDQAQAIFNEIGAQLRRQREILGISPEDVERDTRLRIRYIKALESGRIDELPSPVQARGMLSNYANFLGMNPDPILLQFADGLQASLAARQAVRAQTQPVKKKAAPRRTSLIRRLVPLDMLLASLLLLIIGGVVVWGIFKISSLQSEETPEVTAPSIADILTMRTETPTPALTSTAIVILPSALPPQETAQSTPDLTEVLPELEGTSALAQSLSTATATLPPFPLSAVQVYVVVRQRAWMQVVVDGKSEFAGRVMPGSAFLFSGKERVEILTGNGAALNIYFNQVDQGPLGMFGEVVYRVYTPEGVLAPTPTITLTSSPTTTPAVTLTPTMTPTETLIP